MTIYHSKNLLTENLTKGEILERVSPLSIFEKYFGKQIVFGRRYNSPFRKDVNPSFVFFEGKSKLMFHDFSTGKSGDCFDFVATMYSISFADVLKMIAKDFNIVNSNQEVYATKVVAPRQRKEKLFQVITQRFTSVDLNYWARFGITKEILKKYQVYSLKEVWLNKELIAKYSPEDPIFGLYFPNTEHIKIYRPLTRFKKNKWLGNSSREDIHGENALEYKQDTIILTSSLKDVMVLKVLGFEAIALNSEGAKPNERVLEILSKYKYKYVLYDNDAAGIAYAEMIKTLIPDIEILEIIDDETKDPSDFYYRHGKEKLTIMIDGQIEQRRRSTLE